MMRWLTDACFMRNGKKQVGIAGKSVQKGGLLMLIMLLALLACPISACADELAPAVLSQNAGGNDTAAAPAGQANGAPQDMLLLMQAPIEVMLRQQAAAMQQALAAAGIPESGTGPQETPAQGTAAPEAAPAEADEKVKGQEQAVAGVQESAGSQQAQEIAQPEAAAVNGNNVTGDEESQAEPERAEPEGQESGAQQQREQEAQESEDAGETERQAEPEQSEAESTEKSAESSTREAVQPENAPVNGNSVQEEVKQQQEADTSGSNSQDSDEKQQTAQAGAGNENAPENGDRVESEGGETDQDKDGDVSLSGNEIAGGSEDGKGGETDGDSEAETGRDEDVSLSGNEIAGGSDMDEAEETAGEDRMPTPLSANTIPLSGNAAPRTALEDACADLGLSCSGTTITGISNANLVPEILHIPAGVTDIARWVFMDSTEVKEIYLPDSLEEINQYAFWRATGLEKVVGGSGLHSIYNSAFDQCTNLKYIDFSACIGMLNSTSLLGSGIFANCPNLETLVLRKDVMDHQAPNPATGAFSNSSIKKLIIVLQNQSSTTSTVSSLATDWRNDARNAASNYWRISAPKEAAVILNDGVTIDLTAPLQNQVLSVEYFTKYGSSSLTDYTLLQECFNSNSKMSATVFGLSTDEGSEGVLTYQCYADFVVAMSSQGANSGLDALDQFAMDTIVSRLVSGLEFGANEIPPIQVSVLDI